MTIGARSRKISGFLKPHHLPLYRPVIVTLSQWLYRKQVSFTQVRKIPEIDSFKHMLTAIFINQLHTSHHLL